MTHRPGTKVVPGTRYGDLMENPANRAESIRVGTNGKGAGNPWYHHLTENPKNQVELSRVQKRAIRYFQPTG